MVTFSRMHHLTVDSGDNIYVCSCRFAEGRSQKHCHRRHISLWQWHYPDNVAPSYIPLLWRLIERARFMLFWSPRQVQLVKLINVNQQRCGRLRLTTFCLVSGTPPPPPRLHGGEGGEMSSFLAMWVSDVVTFLMSGRTLGNRWCCHVSPAQIYFALC